MRFPSDILEAAHGVLGEPIEHFGFVTPRQPLVVGYLHAGEEASVTVQSRTLGHNQKPGSVALVPDTQVATLVWIKVTPNDGPTLYWWTYKEQRHHYLAFGTQSPDSLNERVSSQRVCSRWQQTWRLAHQTGLEAHVLYRLCRNRNDMQVKLAVHLAGWLLVQADKNLTAARARADELVQSKNKAIQQALQGHEAAELRGNDLPLVVQGAKVILDNLPDA